RVDIFMQRQRDASTAISNAQLIGKRLADGARRSAVGICMTVFLDRHHEQSIFPVCRASCAARIHFH
ncbi:hypothetical protein, partial [Burkholderia territorii]|uniref:hypothetical protein n=1 Tax=Burkholderia territorii TaxID=1503055 RepID=UPI001E305730